MLRRTLKELRDGILSIAYPEDCRICSRPVESHDDGVVCSSCWRDATLTLSLCESGICYKCGVTFLEPARKNAAYPQDNRLRLCGSCETAPFTFARSCGPYAGALEANILFMKTRPHICSRLRAIVRETVLRHQEALAADVVIPVPLHRRRERSRGFNQATIVAKSIAADFDLPLDDRTLVRVKDTERHRAGMDVMDRRRSVAGAFEVLRPRLIEGAAVLLVDDVYTTGSTVSAAAAVLAGAGASRVGVFTVSRVVEKESRVSHPEKGSLAKQGTNPNHWI